MPENREKNTAPIPYDDFDGQSDNQEDILLNETELLQGLLELGTTKDQEQNYRKIEIKRNGIVKIQFRVRPLTEDEQQNCMKRATKSTARQTGRNSKPAEINRTLFRSLLIYTATINEDRAKLWDNKAALEAYNILNNPEIIDKVLLAGEKDRIIDIIEEISGYGNDEDDKDDAFKTAGN